MADILIVDKKDSFREGIKSIIEMKFGRSFSIQSGDFSELFEICYSRRKPPALIITEYTGGEEEENCLKRFKEKGTKIVLLLLDPTQVKSVDVSLFDGFLVKNMKTSELIRVLQQVLENGKVYVHPAVGYHFYRELAKNY